MEVNQYAQQIKEEHPDFKIGLGNEIYLCPNREKNQKYYHFILIAKNKQGHKALRELSSNAWLNSFYDRGMERVVTTYNDIERIVAKYPHSLVATTACLGGEASTLTSQLISAEHTSDFYSFEPLTEKITNFITWCQKQFQDDFYIEVAPGCSREQILVNQRLVQFAKFFNVKVVLGSDAHYLKKEDRYVHKAYLNSKGGEREVDDFYEYAYLQTEEEIQEHLSKSIPNEYETLIENSIEIYNKIEDYSLCNNQSIANVPVKNYPKGYKVDKEKYPTLDYLANSDDIYHRYWVNQCCDKIKEIIPQDKQEQYYERLEEEADVKVVIGESKNTNMIAYPVVLQHYIDLIWNCGSIVGAGRGSSCSGLNHYLLGVTQLDSIEWDLPFFRYLNKERREVGDIDIDICPSKRPLILNKIKEERSNFMNDDIDQISKENLGCTLVATFGRETSRSAVLTACRGYRSEEFPDGIDIDIGQYLSSLIPQERGFVRSLPDVIYGNEDKGWKPIQSFVKEVEQYPGLMDIMLGIELLINKRSSHASGVIMFDGDPYETCCFMRTPKGEVITQYDLHASEAAGNIKYDFLVTEVSDKITQTLLLLQGHNEIDKSLTLRQMYEKYLHPNVIPLDKEECWTALKEGSVLNCFQFDSEVGSQAAKKLQPHNIIELADANGLMRLMTAEKEQESPMDKYARFKKNIKLWYQEMDRANLTKEEQKTLEPYFLSSYGVPPSQEQLMRMLMDKNICGFSLAEANDARKIVGKICRSKK